LISQISLCIPMVDSSELRDSFVYVRRVWRPGLQSSQFFAPLHRKPRPDRV